MKGAQHPEHYKSVHLPDASQGSYLLEKQYYDSNISVILLRLEQRISLGESPPLFTCVLL